MWFFHPKKIAITVLMIIKSKTWRYFNALLRQRISGVTCTCWIARIYNTQCTWNTVGPGFIQRSFQLINIKPPAIGFIKVIVYLQTNKIINLIIIIDRSRVCRLSICPLWLRPVWRFKTAELAVVCSTDKIIIINEV